MATHATLQPPKTPWGKRFAERSVMRSLICYTVGSLLEVALMTIRTSDETQVLVGLADDLLSKLGILLLASFLFGFSFILFRVHLPSAAKRFLHIVILFVPIILVSQSLVNDANLDTQAYVGYYFFAVLIYLAVYGVCMLISYLIHRNRAEMQ